MWAAKASSPTSTPLEGTWSVKTEYGITAKDNQIASEALWIMEYMMRTRISSEIQPKL
jgi:hypothetical protein